MQIALGVPQTVADWKANVAGMQAQACEAAERGAQLIVFSEAAVTGYVNTGAPLEDLALGQPIPGTATDALATTAVDQQIWIATGIFERVGDTLYDAAVLIAPTGHIALRYRRIDSHWHHWHSRPCSLPIYAQGERFRTAQTPFGRCAFLLCGDLFNPDCQHRLRRSKPDWLLFPMARGWEEDVADAPQWYDQDRYYYIEVAKRAGVGLVLVNQLASIDPEAHYFGGAMVVAPDGTILAEQPLQQPGLLVVDVGGGQDER